MTIALSSFELPSDYNKQPSKFVTITATDSGAVRQTVNPNNNINDWVAANLSAEDQALWESAKQARENVRVTATAAGDFTETGAGIFEWKSAEIMINYMQSVDPTLQSTFTKVWYLFNQETYTA